MVKILLYILLKHIHLKDYKRHDLQTNLQNHPKGLHIKFSHMKYNRYVCIIKITLKQNLAMNKTISDAKREVTEYRILFPICLLAIVTFIPTFFNGFQMEWDDQWMVVNSQTVGYPSWYLLLSMFTIPSHGQIAPINQMMYTFIYICFGFNPLAYHCACLLLHVINIILLYYGLHMILSDCITLPSGRIKWILFITTTLFAVHPLQVESVAWISASKILLSTTFYFAGIILLIKYLRKRSMLCYTGALLMQTMAYLSKEQAVVFPLIATLIYLWYKQSPKDKKFWIQLFPFYLLGLVSVIHEVFYVSGYNHIVQGETYVWWQRLVFCVYSVFTYLFKWLAPVNLNWMYLFPVGLNEKLQWWLILYPVLSVFLVYSFWDWIKKPIVLSSLAFFFIHLLLVIHIIVLPRAAVIADRYMYISIISLNFILAYYVSGIKEIVKNKKISYGIISLIIAILVALSFSRTMDWKDSDTLRSATNTEISSSQESN